MQIRVFPSSDKRKIILLEVKILTFSFYLEKELINSTLAKTKLATAATKRKTIFFMPLGNKKKLALNAKKVCRQRATAVCMTSG